MVDAGPELKNEEKNECIPPLLAMTVRAYMGVRDTKKENNNV